MTDDFDCENWEPAKMPAWSRERCVEILDHWLTFVDLADPDERELADEMLDLRERLTMGRTQP